MVSRMSDIMRFSPLTCLTSLLVPRGVTRRLHILCMCSRVQEHTQCCISDVTLIRRCHFAAVPARLPQFTRLVTVASLVVICLPNFLELASWLSRLIFVTSRKLLGFISHRGWDVTPDTWQSVRRPRKLCRAAPCWVWRLSQ